MLSPAAKEIISASMGGILQVFAGQPFDIVKVRVQNSTSSISPITVLKDILRNEGPLALYKGTMSPLSTVPLMIAFQFTFNGATKRAFIDYNKRHNKSNPYDQGLAQYMASGATAGIGLSHLSTPIELIRIRCQIQTETASKYVGSGEMFKQIVKDHGI